NPHVHLSVRAESKSGRRLNPRKADLNRWREVFAERLRDWGIDAEATRQPTRGVARSYPDLWQVKAKEEGRLRQPRSDVQRGARAQATRAMALEAWQALGTAMERAGVRERDLGERINRLVTDHLDRR